MVVLGIIPKYWLYDDDHYQLLGTRCLFTMTNNVGFNNTSEFFINKWDIFSHQDWDDIKNGWMTVNDP